MNSKTALRPLLRWAGGKQRITGRLLGFLPRDLSRRLYVEPFLGAGSLFTRLAPKDAVVSDANADLIAFYTWLRHDSALIARHLRTHVRNDSPQHYYEVRATFNNRLWNAAQAARFLYLNCTCFNGIYRVNSVGAFNVPYGQRARRLFPTGAELARHAELLSSTTLLDSCFTSVLPRIPRKSFVYLDPPYPPLNGTSFFQHYTLDRFTNDDQDELAEHVRHLHKRGSLFMMSNADVPKVRERYADFRIDSLQVPRWVSCKGSKHRVDELVIRNY